MQKPTPAATPRTAVKPGASASPPPPAPVKPRARKSRLVAGAASVTLLLLAAGFYFYWRTSHPGMLSNPPAFSSVGPLLASSGNFQMRASLALQSEPGSGGQMSKKKEVLESTLSESLSTALAAALEGGDAHALLKPGGLAALQVKMANSVNQKLGDKAVDAVLLTDLLIVQQD